MSVISHWKEQVTTQLLIYAGRVPEFIFEQPQWYINQNYISAYPYGDQLTRRHLIKSMLGEQTRIKIIFY